MSPQAERDTRRRGGRFRFLRDLASDPLRKLLAVALAVPLWIFLDRQVTEPRTERFRLLAAGANAEPGTYPLRVDLSAAEQYRVKGFRDVVDDSDVGSVEITFKGPKHIVLDFLDAPDVFVRPRASAINPQTNVFVFDRGDIRSADPNIVSTLTEMRPARVAVVLERVATEPVILTMSRVQVELPDPARFPDFRARLRLDAAEFSERQVMLRGARQAIDLAVRDDRQLFRLDLKGHGPTTAPRVSTALALLPGLDVTMLGSTINVSIPLDPKFEEYDLRVPVLLDTLARGPAPAEYEYEPSASVKLSVSGELAGTLSTLAADARDGWAQDNMRVDIRLPADWNGDSTYFLGTLRLLDPRYLRGRDFQGVDQISVQVRLKKKE